MIFRRTRIGAIAALLITAARLLVIDIDPPVRDLTDYLAKDEAFYVFPAYDLFERGETFSELPPHWCGMPVVTNVLAYFGLQVFGDNYLGLRIGSLLLAMACIVLVQLVLERLTKDRWLLLLLPLVLVSDLSFGFASILVEPTISRMAMMLLLLGITQRWLARGPLSLMRASLLAALAVWLSIPTYLTSAFVVPAVCLSILIRAWQDRPSLGAFIKLALVLGCACLVAAVLLFGITTLLGSKDLQAMARTTDSYAGRISLSLTGWFQNVRNIADGNLFRLNPVLFLLATGSILLLFVKPIRRWGPGVVTTFSFTLLFLLQTVFINDYPMRKLLLLLPLVLLLIAVGQEHVREVMAVPAAPKAWQKVLLPLLALATACWAWTSIRMSGSAPPVVLRCLLPGCIVFIGVAVLWPFRPRRFGTWGLPPWILAAFIVPGTINSVRMMVVERTYAYRDFQRALQEYGDARFIGAASMGFRTYNDIRTELNPYVVEGAYARSWPILERSAEADPRMDYSIGYADQVRDFERIGFAPVREFVLAPEETWPERQFVVYKEVVPRRPEERTAE